VTPSEFFSELSNNSNSVVLDVRTLEEFNAGHLDKAVNIPVDDLRQRLDEVPGDKNIFLYCRGGYRSYLATRILINNGFNSVKNIQGGYMLISQVQQILSKKM
jgi:rhodanese-related sulfurtransferase